MLARRRAQRHRRRRPGARPAQRHNAAVRRAGRGAIGAACRHAGVGARDRHDRADSVSEEERRPAVVGASVRGMHSVAFGDGRDELAGVAVAHAARLHREQPRPRQRRAARVGLEQPPPPLRRRKPPDVARHHAKGAQARAAGPRCQRLWARRRWCSRPRPRPCSSRKTRCGPAHCGSGGRASTGRRFARACGAAGCAAASKRGSARLHRLRTR